MKVRFILLAIAILLTLISADRSKVISPVSSQSCSLPQTQDYQRLEARLSITQDSQEVAFQARSLAIRKKLATQNLDQLDAWWRREKIYDPHKYLLPVILARLSLGNHHKLQPCWDMLLKLDKEKPELYHFRSVFDIPIFLRFRSIIPKELEASYRSMLNAPRVLEWMNQGTENHMFMQRLSGLALMEGSGFPNPLPGTAANNEAWLRSELNKFLTIGQGEFHSSTYYGYAISGLLNLYDFARTPQLKQLAKAGLDWYAANMAVRLSWGTAGGVESRGFDRGTWDGSGLSAVAWVWWGDAPETAQRIDVKYAQSALLAALSNYRPPAQLKALAKKEIPLPFQLQASHPGYYSYRAGNQFWETFYVTPDYSLGTLLEPQRSYQIKETINSQYAVYKLVVRDPKGISNAVVSLGGTFHSPMATGRSPGDQYMQEKGAVIYQLRLNQQDKAAGVPAHSHLVLPARYGEPQRHGDWYIWRIEQTWLCARPWGEISWQQQVSEKNKDYQALVASGTKMAWITDVGKVAEYPDLKALTRALDQTQVDAGNWDTRGQLAYTTLHQDRLMMTYEPNGGIGHAIINGRERVLKNWSVLASPYIKEALDSGLLEVLSPDGTWHLRATLTGPKWE